MDYGNLTENQKYGIRLECPTAMFFKQKLGLKTEHNDYSPSKYPMENKLAVDVVVHANKWSKILIECTNPKRSTFFGDDVIQRKLNHFLECDPSHRHKWVLLTTFEIWSKNMKQWIEENQVMVITLNFRVEEEDFDKVINSLFHSRLYSIAKKLSTKRVVRNRAQTPITKFVKQESKIMVK